MTKKIYKISNNKSENMFKYVYFSGDSAPFSAIAFIALSIVVCTFAQAKSNSIKL